MRRLRKTFKLDAAKKLLTPYWREKNKISEIHSTGFCYIATEALFYMIGGLSSGYKPCLIVEGDETHWFLQNTENKKLDPTADQYHPEKPPYHLAKGCGFLNGYVQPSKRAKALIELATEL